MGALKFRSNGSGVVAMLLVLVTMVGFSIYSPFTRPSSLASKTCLSQATLEEKYGVRVNLVGITAAGGMVDLRLKIIDSQKANLLLADKNNFPALYVDGANTTLNASEEEKSQEIQLADNGSLFILYPNTGNAVKPGARIDIIFGDTALEPIEVK